MEIASLCPHLPFRMVFLHNVVPSATFHIWSRRSPDTLRSDTPPASYNIPRQTARLFPERDEMFQIFCQVGVSSLSSRCCQIYQGRRIAWTVGRKTLTRLWPRQTAAVVSWVLHKKCRCFHTGHKDSLNGPMHRPPPSSKHHMRKYILEEWCSSLQWSSKDLENLRWGALKLDVDDDNPVPSLRPGQSLLTQ